MTTTIFTEMSFFCYQIGVNFVETAGMIIEYNPMHTGHLHLLRQTRAALGADTAVIGVMSGNFVQRGRFCPAWPAGLGAGCGGKRPGPGVGASLPWAISSAEGFADGAVEILESTGLVTYLAFGSECADIPALMETAACLRSECYRGHLRRF